MQAPDFSQNVLLNSTHQLTLFPYRFQLFFKCWPWMLDCVENEMPLCNLLQFSLGKALTSNPTIGF